jgi:hypothetical protein
MSNNSERASDLFYSAVALLSSVLDSDTGFVRDEYRGETWGAIDRHLRDVSRIVTSLSHAFGDNERETYACLSHNAKARATFPIARVSA